jgi:hypothetical protein
MKAKLIFILMFAALLPSCEEDGYNVWREESGLYKPKCTITSVTKIDKDENNHFPKLKVVVLNKEDGITAYTVGANVKFKRGDLIVERGMLYFGTLKRGERMIDETYLSLDSHSDYTRCVITLTWSDSGGRTFQREFVY